MLNPVIDIPCLARAVERFQPAGRPFQEVRQRKGFEFLHHRFGQPVAAEYRMSVLIGHRLKPRRFKAEIGRSQPPAHLYSNADTGIKLAQEPAKRLTNQRKGYRLLFPGDAEAYTFTVELTCGCYVVPIIKLRDLPGQYGGCGAVHLLKQQRHFGRNLNG
ncbi:hypothetical protein D3C75_933840 [compost metagenome]